MSLVPELKSGPLTFYLFLPAGAKLFTILIFSWRGAIGVGLGTFSRLLFVDQEQAWSDWFLVATITTLLLFLAIEAALKALRIDRELSNLRYYHIVVLAVIASIVNGAAFICSLNWVAGRAMDNGLFQSSFATVLSNFAGNAIFVCTLMLLLEYKKPILSLIIRIKNKIISS